MKTFALIAVAASAIAAPTAALAQAGPGVRVVHPGTYPGGYRPNYPGGWNGGWNGGGWNRGGWNTGSSFGGFAFGGFWQQPQYHVQNWQLYGFVAPGPQQRWVRYYDDAYLVDGRGYVHGRHRGVRWDRGGERWGRDDRGIPYYVGNGDYYPDGRDYARAEAERRWGGDGWNYDDYDRGCGRPDVCDGPGRERRVIVDRDVRHGGHDDGYRGGPYRDERRVVVRDGGHGGYRVRDGYDYGHGDGRVGARVYTTPGLPAPCGGGCGSVGYGSGYNSGYGYGAGHGYGSGGTVVVTETTVTQGEVIEEEIVEEVIEERAATRRHRPVVRHRAPAPRRHAPAPRRVIQPSGERG